MNRLGKTWCDVCKKDTHNTKECWGVGTVAYPPSAAYNAPPPFFDLLMNATRQRDLDAALRGIRCTVNV